MRILVAPQEFKGTLTAREAAAAIADGVRRALPHAEIDRAPMADGGPGTVEALVAATGGHIVSTEVSDPLGRRKGAEWGLLSDGTAVIEMSAAAGLTLLAADELDPRRTTTYGVGELIASVLDRGGEQLIIGLGGSATNDGGAGMAQALGAHLLDVEGRELPLGGAALSGLDRIDTSRFDQRAGAATILAASDVRNPLCGPEGASFVYGPQKGATKSVAEELDRALAHYARVIERDLGVAVADVPGAGAAGGLGAGLIAFLRAEIRPGAQLVAERIGLRRRAATATLVITGEGRLDEQSRYGKVSVALAEIAGGEKVPVIVVAGELGKGWESVQALFDQVEPVVGAISREEALADPAGSLADATERAVRRWIATARV